MKKLLFTSAFLTFSFLFISVLNPDSANAAVCKGECRFYADGCKPGFLETSGECDAPYICCEQKPSPTPKPPGPACKGRCEFYADGCDIDEKETSGQCDPPLICCEKKDSPPPGEPSPTPSIKPGDNKCAGSCRYYADGCQAGDVQTSGQCDSPNICCEKKGSGSETPPKTKPPADVSISSCQGKCEYYLEGCGFGLKPSNNSCGSDKLICCEPKDGVIDPKLGTYIPDCDGTWAPEEISCVQEGEKNGPMPGFTCCKVFPNSPYGSFNPYTDPAARKALELYGYWFIPESSCYGKCEWGSKSCSVFGKLPAYGQCSGEKQGAPVACCGETIANAGQGSCYQGNSYCASGETSQVTACRVDKKGYVKIQCADGYFCPPNGTHCIPNLTAADLLNPQKAKLFDACKWNFECQTNYCNRINKCDISPDEITKATQAYIGAISAGGGQGQTSSSFLVPGWSGLDPDIEKYLNKVIDDIQNFEDYCSGPYPNYQQCAESITTGIALSLIAVPFSPGITEAALHAYSYASTFTIPQWAPLLGAILDAGGILMAQYRCSHNDFKACEVARELAIWSYAGYTSAIWNNLPTTVETVNVHVGESVSGDVAQNIKINKVGQFYDKEYRKQPWRLIIDTDQDPALRRFLTETREYLSYTVSPDYDQYEALRIWIEARFPEYNRLYSTSGEQIIKSHAQYYADRRWTVYLGDFLDNGCGVCMEQSILQQVALANAGEDSTVATGALGKLVGAPHGGVHSWVEYIHPKTGELWVSDSVWNFNLPFNQAVEKYGGIFGDIVRYKVALPR